ncbi:MAG: hypothetical protein E7406_00750 [Ruminococcaceae bacterium]|nr:hypothetical protein [Oscillospiraceae bacterium]
MKKIALIQIILASILWGTSGIFVHYLAPYGFTSLQMTFFRSVVSCICLALYILIFNKKLFKVTLKQLLLFTGSGLSFFLTATCYFYSMQATSISTAVVLMYTAPIFVMIYSVMFLGEKLNPKKAVAVLTMFVGCGLVSGIIGGLKFDAMGIVIGFMSGIAYSAYNILTKIEMKGNSNPLSATLYCFLFATLIGAFTCGIGDIPQSIGKAPQITVPLVIGMGLATCISPYFLYTLAMRKIPAGTASSLGIIEPMAATLFSVIIFGETLSVASVSGIVLILGAVFLLSKSD